MIGGEQPAGSLLDEDVVVAFPGQVHIVVVSPLAETSELRVPLAATRLPALLDGSHAAPFNDWLQTSRDSMGLHCFEVLCIAELIGREGVPLMDHPLHDLLIGDCLCK